MFWLKPVLRSVSALEQFWSFLDGVSYGSWFFSL